MKRTLLTALPPGVTTRTLPLAAPAGTVARILVGDRMVNVAGLLLLKITVLVPLKCVPLMTIASPTAPELFEKPLIVGGGVVRVNVAALVAVPPDVVTVIRPCVAEAGTTAVILLAETTRNDAAATPLKSTAVAPFNFRPAIVTTAPAGARSGRNEMIVGG
jgi:hypothetical protein